MKFWPFGTRGAKPSGRKSASYSGGGGSSSAVHAEDIFASMRGLSDVPQSDYDRIREAQSHPIVMACVRRISWSAASVKMGIEALNGDVMYDHPLAQRLAETNSPGGRWTLLQLVSASLALCGRAYVYAPRSKWEGNAPVMLGFLNTHKVQRIVDATSGEITGYRYTTMNAGTGTMILDPADVCEIRHHWLLDHDDVFGHSTLESPAYSQMQASWRPMTLFAGLSDLIRKLLANNGGMPGIISLEAGASGGQVEPLSDTQKEELAEYFKRFRGGGDKYGEMAFLDTAGLKLNFTKITEDLKTVNMEGGKKAAMAEICAVMGVPPLILGMGEGATYANQAEARRYFWMDTVIPGYVDPICSALSAHFGIKIVPDLSDIPALADYNLTRSTQLDACTFMTINEKRRQMNLKDIMGGDIVMVNPMLQPINRMLDANGNNLSDETDNWVANQEALRVSLETGQPPKLPALAPPQQQQAPPGQKGNNVYVLPAVFKPNPSKESGKEPRKVNKRRR